MMAVSNWSWKRRDKLRHELRLDLQRRMSRPQRHRLLHGYPMAPLMRPAPQGVLSPVHPLDFCALDHRRPLIIGVLPHTFCTPKVRGCGFCTFPHETFVRKLLRDVVEHIVQEIAQTVRIVRENPLTVADESPLQGRRVDGVYFGGGTANLTPPAELQKLCDALHAAFDLSTSEVTLEGVPRYFLLHDGALFDVLAGMKVRHRRVSMGVQTFDRGWIHRMGRDAFGDRDTIEQVVKEAHKRGFTASADMLFNLPGAALEYALDDVRTACAIGFDQICAYNLVLNAELNTEWARDPDLVGAMPDPEKACATWLAVRQALLDHGYVQTTLTNFERADVAASDRRFVYERASFDPATWDALGFGPAAISTFTGRGRRSAIKWMNAGSSQGFVRAMKERGDATATAFHYSLTDLKLLHFTRNFARLSVDGGAYQAFFGSDPHADFDLDFQVLQDARLLRAEGRTIELTPGGMFYADAVVGLLASRRVAELRADSNDGALIDTFGQHMG
jgi:coproporphyrinogen III oxidase-like Fe-S oxidoreductase